MFPGGRVAAWAALAATGCVAGAALLELPGVLSGLPDPARCRATAGEFLGHWGGVGHDVVIALLLAASLARWGAALLRWLRAGAARRGTERAAVRILAGAGLGSTAILGCGLAGLLFPPWLAGLGIAAAVAVPSGRGRGRASRPAPVAGLPGVRPVFIAGLVLLGAQALAPQIWTDPLAYHLAAPQRFLALHRETAGWNFCFRFPLLPEQLMMLSADLLPPPSFIAVSLGALLLLVHGWASRGWGVTAGRLAAAGVLASSLTGFDAVQPKPDLLAAAFALLAVSDLVPRRPGGSAALAGAAIGWAFCSKYPAAAPAAGLIGLVAFRRRLAGAGPAAAGFLLAGAPFALRGWLLSGNPAYPFGLGGLHWPEASARLFADRGCPGADFAPWWAGAFRAATACAPLAFVGLPWCLRPAGPRRRDGAGELALVGALSLALWFPGRPCLRYMLPGLLLLGVAGAVAIAGALAAGVRWAGRAAVVALAAGTVHAMIAADRDGAAGQGRIAAGLGLETRESFLARTLTTSRRAALRVAGSRGGNLLLVGDTRGFGFGVSRRVISQDTSDEPLVLRLAAASRSPDHLAGKFRQEHITDIVVNYLGMEYDGALARDYFPWTAEARSRYAAFWNSHAEWLDPGNTYDERNGGFAWFRLHPRARRAVPLPFLPGTEGEAAWRPGETPGAYEARMRALVAAMPDISLPRTRLGAALVRRGAWDEARRELEKGLRSGFEAEGIRLHLARALDGLGRTAEAGTERRRAAALRAARERP